jgi:hypothetical protein
MLSYHVFARKLIAVNSDHTTAVVVSILALATLAKWLELVKILMAGNIDCPLLNGVAATRKSATYFGSALQKGMHRDFYRS